VVEKLEQILHAEDRARRTVESAREQADTLMREAVAESQILVADAERDSRAEAHRLTVHRMDQARAGAERLAQEAGARMREEITQAEHRIDAAAEAVARELLR
jgi:vacuolar-type H+-ATPase subunit H